MFIKNYQYFIGLFFHVPPSALQRTKNTTARRLVMCPTSGFQSHFHRPQRHKRRNAGHQVALSRHTVQYRYNLIDFIHCHLPIFHSPCSQFNTYIQGFMVFVYLMKWQLLVLVPQDCPGTIQTIVIDKTKNAPSPNHNKTQQIQHGLHILGPHYN